MNFEDVQKSWQNQTAGMQITINSELLLKEVRRNQQQFRATIYSRDVREVVVAVLLIPVFIYLGRRQDNWGDYLVAFACFVVGAFFLIDRRQQKNKTSEQCDSLKDCAAASLAEVRHQIWLLKNILWWYLLPLFVPIVISICWPTLHSGKLSPVDAAFLLGPIGAIAAVYWFLYWLNQYAIKKQLDPRRQELEKLLNELGSENNSNGMKIKKPLSPLLLVLAVCIITIIADATMKNKPATNIENIRKKYKVPALAVVVTKDGKICDRAAAGVRKWSDPTPVTTNDVFHIGSCTKSMTATLAAMFIEQGNLRWDTTIAEVFPELKGKMDKRYEAVTIEQLLHHRGGVPPEPPPGAWARAWQEIGTPREQRRGFIEAVLSAPPEAEPGTKMIYSNQGYDIVGAMLEKISGRDFESLMREKLFKPLHMDSAGFGPPGTEGKVDEPWGHVRQHSQIVPVQSDNPPVHSPCGRVHCSLDDLARYAMFHLQAGTNGLLKPETMARLHASPEGAEVEGVMDDYACGWVRMRRDWAGGPVLWHNGSNTMWYTVMWLAPEKNFCVIAASNIAGDDAEKACDDACVAMIQKWLQ